MNKFVHIPKERMTLDKIEEAMKKFNFKLPPSLVPNPCDIGPRTAEALKAKCVVLKDVPELKRVALGFSGIQFHIRHDVIEGFFHPCRCRTSRRSQHAINP